jgi:hypothetical protein
MNIRIGFSAFLILLAIASCRDETPYVPVGPHFSIEYSIHANGNIDQLINVNLFTGDLVQYGELKDGGMKVNGEPMTLGLEEHELPVYYVENPVVVPNTAYKFEIPLADGTIASAEVITQQNAPTELTTPPSASSQDDMSVSWPAVSNHDQMVLSVYYTAKNSSDEQLAASFKLTSDEIATGSYNIPRETFLRSNIKSARIQLIGYKSGTTKNFKNGGRIVSKMTIEKVVDVK